MSKILITYGTRPLAQRVAKILAKHEVLFASCEEVPSILESKYQKIPNGMNPVYVHELLKLCLNEGVELLLPLADSEFQAIQESRVLFEEYGIEVLLPNTIDGDLLKNPSSDLEIEVFKNGASLSSNNEEFEITGLYTYADGSWYLTTL